MLGASRPVDPAELKDSKGFFFYFFLFIYVSSYSKKSVERGYFIKQKLFNKKVFDGDWTRGDSIEELIWLLGH